MDPLQEIRNALSAYGKVSFDPIIRKLHEVEKVVQPNPREPLTPRECIRDLQKFEAACKKAFSEGEPLVDSLEEGYDGGVASKIVGLVDDFDYVALEEYESNREEGLMYSLAMQFSEIREELTRQYERIEKALQSLEFSV